MRNNESIFYVYILICGDNSLYTGYTNDPVKRLSVHNKGKGAKYTRNRLPVSYVFLRAFTSKISAMSAEKRIKNLRRADKLRLMAGEFEDFWKSVKRI